MASAASDRRTNLSADEIHAVNASAFAGEEFEPFVGRMVETSTLYRVIDSGLVESGPSCRPAVGEIGYRLTAQGWEAFKRTARGPRRE
jgi:hypothetical protein